MTGWRPSEGQEEAYLMRDSREERYPRGREGEWEKTYKVGW